MEEQPTTPPHCAVEDCFACPPAPQKKGSCLFFFQTKKNK